MENALIQEIKELVVEACNLEEVGISAADLESDAPLVGPDSPHGIDSLDAIEIVAAVEKKYKVRISSVDSAQKLLRTVRVLADFIASKQEVPA